MLLLFIIGVVIAFCAPLLHRVAGKASGYLLALLPLCLFIYFLTFLPAISGGDKIEQVYQWVPQLGVDISFYLDGLSLFFALLVSGFGVLIVLYASSYLKTHVQLGRFYLYLLLFMMSMIGVVVAGSLISLFVFWELTSLTSYLLISFDHEKGTSRAAALQSMLVTVAGGLIMLVGFIFLAVAGGSYDFSGILTNREAIINHDYYSIMVVLVLIGAFTKSAQFPFHFWLPNAMAAPTPVSAYLHSATMVKAGVYLVARFNPVLGGTSLWEILLMVTGTITMLLGAIMAMRYTDLKKILAYTTISALGTLFLMLGVGTAYAVQAAMIFILAHAFYKGTLFMMAGTLDHYAGSRDLKDLSGLRKALPVTAITAILACLSMSGVIPFLGFMGKELIYEAALNATLHNIILLVAVFTSGVITTAIAIDIAYNIFFGTFKSPLAKVKEASWPMLVGPVLLSLCGVLFGIVPHWLTQPLLNISVIQVLADIEVATLSLWHGFNLVLLLSLLTLLLGWIVYYFRRGIRSAVERMATIEKVGPLAMYEKGLNGMLKGSFHITQFLQNGHLRYYIATTIWLFIALLLYIVITRNLRINFEPKISSLLEFRFYEEIICLFIILGVFKIFFTKSRVTAIASMGVVGYGLALIFIIFSAPDTAMTQFLIETLTVVLFVLVLHKLPYFEDLSLKKRRFGYLILSTAFGGIMTYILLLVRSYPMASDLKEYYGEYSIPLGHGRNIVNVILVDFRAMDTMGEAVVLAIAAIGIFTLLKLKLGKEDVL